MSWATGSVHTLSRRCGVRSAGNLSRVQMRRLGEASGGSTVSFAGTADKLSRSGSNKKCEHILSFMKIGELRRRWFLHGRVRDLRLRGSTLWGGS